MVLDVLLKITGALHRAGVPIVAGTDVGVPGHTLHRELELYVKAGMTPLFNLVLRHVKPPQVEDGPFRMLVTILEANPYLGRIVTGRLTSDGWPGA